MVRHYVTGALMGMLMLVPAAGASPEDNADESWKNLILQATYQSADAHDNAKAEQLFLQALHEAQRFGADDVRVGATLNRLGMVYRDEKKAADAEASFRKALRIFDTVYGTQSIDAGNIGFNLASVLMVQGKAPAALPFLETSRLIYIKQLGDASLKTAGVDCMIGDAYRVQKSWQEAEAPLKHCAAVRESNGGMLDADFGEAENSLALVLQKEGKYALADGAFKLAERIRERVLGITSPALADTLEAHAELLKGMGREAEAEKDLKIADSIRKLHDRAK